MKDSDGIVYIAVNKKSLKAYVGQTTYDLGVRISSHWAKRNTDCASHFQRSLKKNGIDGFHFAILERCSCRADLNAAERKWISLLGSQYPDGYNLAAGGEGSLFEKRSQKWHDAVRSEDVRRRQSERARAWRASMTPEQKAEHNRKTGTANKGRVQPNMIGDSNPAKTPENRIKISEGLRRSWQNPEVRERRRLAQQRSLHESNS